MGGEKSEARLLFKQLALNPSGLASTFVPGAEFSGVPVEAGESEAEAEGETEGEGEETSELPLEAVSPHPERRDRISKRVITRV